MPLTSGCSRMVLISLREQVTTLMTPSGTPASLYSWAKSMAVLGVKEAAFSTRVLPAAIQVGAIQPKGIMAGKFTGTMPANTPSGSLYFTVSYPREASIMDSPIIRDGTWVASSVPSFALSTSPSDSAQTLPFSLATLMVSSSMRSRISSRTLYRICARFMAGVALQPG